MTPNLDAISLDLATLRLRYDGGLPPTELIHEVYRRLEATPDAGVWTCVVPKDVALARAAEIARRDRSSLPLYGVPFAVKDNIHVAGLPTTAGCPAYAHTPETSATVVRRMEAAGAILIGKNTMDQFATGLVGIRSLVHPVNSFDPTRIPGGSSSGSAVAVALGFVSVALGSDTGGSGRVPAALNNIVGFKPTPGKISTAGLVPANRSFDCVPVLALTCADAAALFDILAGDDPDDPFLQEAPCNERTLPGQTGRLTVGVPPGAILRGECDDETLAGFERAIQLFDAGGGRRFRQGPPERGRSGCRWHHRGGSLLRRGGALAPAVPSSGAPDGGRAHHGGSRHPRDPDRAPSPDGGGGAERSDRHERPDGRFTYFGNPLNLCAISVPSGLRDDGLPFGLCLYARKNADTALLEIAGRYGGVEGRPLGATGSRSGRSPSA